MQLVQSAATRGTSKLLLRQTQRSSLSSEVPSVAPVFSMRLMVLCTLSGPRLDVVLVCACVGVGLALFGIVSWLVGGKGFDGDGTEGAGGGGGGSCDDGIAGATGGGGGGGGFDDLTMTGVIRVGKLSCWRLRVSPPGLSTDEYLAANDVGAGTMVKNRLSSSPSLANPTSSPSWS